MLNSSKFLSRSLVSLGLCLLSQSAEATYGSGKTSTYVFVAEQSKVVRTGGIASVPLTYTIKGDFQLAIDLNAGSASFAHVDANATDDSPFKRTLDLNHVFNMTSLVGTVESSGSIKFTGKASDDSDINITVTLQDGLAHLIGQTTPPPNSADFFIFNLDAVTQRKYGGGSGTAEDPYQIATAADLIALGETPEDYDKHFILTADIDLAGYVFDEAVIAPAWTVDSPKGRFTEGPPFVGLLDGKDHTISCLVVTGKEFLGLFGWLKSGGEVRNLRVVDVNIVGSGNYIGGLVASNGGSVSHCCCCGSVRGTGQWSSSVGGLAGRNWGDVTDCYTTGVVASTRDDIGGLVGWNRQDITDCYSSASVSGDWYVGGLVGGNGGVLTRCYSTGAVSGTDSVGGLVGRNEVAVAMGTGQTGSAVESYSTATVKGENSVGGLVGDNGFGDITCCYSTGTVSGTENVGGLVGSNTRGDVTYCYSTGPVSGNTRVGGLAGYASEWHPPVNLFNWCFWDIQTSRQATSAGGTGKTTAEMQIAKTFIDARWDFVNIWGIGENQTYPYLRKHSAADINQDSSVNFLDLAALSENWLTDISHR